MAHVYQFDVLERHLDTFGHVNHATYAEIFEEARWAMVTEHGYGLKETMENQQGPIIIEMKLRFKKELVLRESVSIETRAFHPERKIQRVEQKMIKADGSVACEAEYKIGFFDLKRRTLIEPGLAWRNALDI